MCRRHTDFLSIAYAALFCKEGLMYMKVGDDYKDGARFLDRVAPFINSVVYCLDGLDGRPIKGRLWENDHFPHYGHMVFLKEFRDQLNDPRWRDKLLAYREDPSFAIDMMSRMHDHALWRHRNHDGF